MQNYFNSYELNISDVNNRASFGVFMYDIEEHLKQFRDTKNFNILYDSWIIEKNEYKRRLSTVSMTYQAYSLHDASHSEAILKQIAYFLGEKRIRQLSPTDAWLVLECAYCHDLGMVVTAKDLYRECAEMAKEDFIHFSHKMRESRNEDVRLAWNYLEPLFEYGYRKKHEKCEKSQVNTEEEQNLENLKDIFESEWYQWPIHFTDAFRILIQERCRPKHAHMSYDMIKNEVDEKSYEGLIPIRLRNLIAEISVLHMEEQKDILKKLSSKVQGFDGDYAHPQFVAELIRIGDLLDMDNNRFNKYQLAVAGDLGYNSFAHQLKHRAIENYLVTPEIIRVKADFKTKDAKALLQSSNEYSELLTCSQITKDSNSIMKEKMDERAAGLTLKAFKELSGWLQMLHKELDFFCKEWLRIVPTNLIGNCPYFEEEELLLDGKRMENDLIDLYYHITAKRAAEIIEGPELYESIFRAFIRELVQNSMDAIKRKVYLNFIRTRQDNYQTPLQLYRYLADDMEKIIIKIICEEDSQNGYVRFIIRDYGIGITYKRLKEMQHIGTEPDYKTSKQSEEMPLWWKPTGSFGIGMQTIFYFSNRFKLMTRTEEEGLLRKMFFNSVQVGGNIESYVIENVDETNKFNFGTEIEVDITNQMLQRLQKNKEFGRDWDYFGDTIAIFHNKIREAVNIVRGSFGIPIQLILSDNDGCTESRYIKKDEFLLECFGTYFINLAEESTNAQNTIERVSNYNVDLPSDETYRYSGFSCWSEKNHILLRYRWHRKNNREDSVKLYFNEILVNDGNSVKKFQIAFFNMEVYIFDEEPESFLEMNRDKFLYEKCQTIVDTVCNTHLSCLRFLLDERSNDDESEECRYKQDIWKEHPEWKYGQLARAYLRFLINKEDITEYISVIKWFVQEEDVIHSADNLSEEDFPIKNHNIWLIDTRFKFISKIRLRNNFAHERRYIVEDLFTCCMDLAITELLCMEEEAGDYTVLYKVNQHSGQFVSVSEEDFMSYIDMRYQELAQKNPNLGRIILPGIEAYRPLCVSRLVTNLGTMFEKKLDSAIIMPITVGELEKLLGEKSQEEVKAEIEKLLSLQNNPAYGRIVEYIKLHGVSRELDEEDIKNAYRKLLTNIWQELPGR